MEQHPVPQHIASFEFKLFGNLTVRQFVTLAIPGTLAAIIFFSGLPQYLRFTLAIILGGLGFFAALVPIQGRPLDKWLVLFSKAIMAPTQRVWIKDIRLPEFLGVVVENAPRSSAPIEAITTGDRERLKNYLTSLPKGRVSPFDVKEQIAIERLNLSMEGASAGKLPPAIVWSSGNISKNQTSLPQVKQTEGGVNAPMPQMREVGMPVSEEEYQGVMAEALPAIALAPASAKISHHAKPYALPGLEKRLTKTENRVVPHVQLASDVNFSIENIIPIASGRRVKLVHGVGRTRTRKLHFAPPAGFDLNNLPIRGEARFEVSQQLKSGIDPRLFEEPQKKAPDIDLAQLIPAKEERKIEYNKAKEIHQVVNKVHQRVISQSTAMKKPTESEGMGEIKVSVSSQKPEASRPAAMLSKAQIVPLTNKPNVLSGLIADKNGVPLEAAILTVRDASGVPVRALKTNKLGQFLSATPMPSGAYTLEIDSAGNIFDPLKLEMAGEVLAPLSIKAKGGSI